MSSGNRERLAVASGPADKRRKWRLAARLLARSRTVRRLLRRLIWFDRALEMAAESARSAAVHQLRWAHALEHGSTMPLFVLTPAEMRPEKFADHMEKCRCVFWHWFLAQGIDREIRTVLDVGCGLGYVTHHFVLHGYDVTGVTCNPHEKAECLQRGIKIVEEDFHFLSAPDGQFDLVIASHSLEHSIAPLFALWEWKRVLRPGGYLLIAIPMPIEQDARAAYPDYYDPASDTLSFPATHEGAFSAEEGGAACSTYGAGLHPFVLSSWQLKWLFRLAGFETAAESAEDPIVGEVRGIELMDGCLPADSRHLMNGLFLLRKPTQSAQ